MSRLVIGVRLEDLGDVVTLREYCGLYRECESKVRYQVKTGTCRVPPAMTRPLRWRRADLVADINTATASADRKKFARARMTRATSPAPSSL
jgi:hypothetical protein